jgi:hypothetical protein
MVFTGLASKQAVTISGGLTSKPVVTVSGSLASKPAAMVFSALALKPVAMIFSSLASKLVAMVFSSLASKLVATVSPGLASKPVMDFLIEPQHQGGGGFSGLGLKIKWASVCRLRHKTDRGRSVRDTRQDLAACFTWKQVWPEDWQKHDDGWCTWHHHVGCIRVKLKIDGSM